MADEKHQSIHELEPVEKADREFGAHKMHHHKVGRRGLVFAVIILAFLTLGLLATTAYMLAGGYMRRNVVVNDSGVTTSRMMRFGGDRSGIGYGSYVNTQVSSGTVTTTVYTTQTGVVTAVNGDSIVIAGNGKQTTIKTNSSTQYDNGTKPAVNDTVTVIGTTADNTTTATELGVVNQ